jgi:hypothetical protein
MGEVGASLAREKVTWEKVDPAAVSLPGQAQSAAFTHKKDEILAVFPAYVRLLSPVPNLLAPNPAKPWRRRASPLRTRHRRSCFKEALDYAGKIADNEYAVDGNVPTPFGGLTTVRETALS